MKKILFPLVLILSVGTIVAQENGEKGLSKSKVVEMLNKEGVLLKKEFYDIGKIPVAEFQNVIITDISSGKRFGALRVQTSTYTSTGTDTYIGTLDYDEIEDCIKSLSFFKNGLIVSIPPTYTECAFKTKDGVSFGAYLHTTKKEQYWRLFIKTKSYTDRSQKFMDIDQLDVIIDILNKALENMGEYLN